MEYSVRLSHIVLAAVSCCLLEQASWSQSISQSHIEGNVPSDADFDALLTRDLQAYFNARATKVTYQLLRKAPTQSGVAYPKFYAWVRLFKGSQFVEEGAVRVAAIERTHFEVTNYLSSATIAASPFLVADVFPQALLPDIRKRAGEQ